MILSCWIVDDEPLALSLLESYVNKTPFLNLTGKYSSAVSAMKNLETETIDVIFLDIQMPDVNGMEFSRIVDNHTRIVFTTAFSEYALDGYKVSAIDYLLKPISYSDFLMAAKKALNWFEMTQKKGHAEEKKETGIFVKSEYKLIQILFDELLYVEGLKDYIKIYTETDTKPVLTLMSMKSMEEALPPDRFIRVHRSYIVQKNKIESVNKNRLVINGKEIPIGETYKQNFMASLDK
ncbi:MAG: LytTR family DNA-binding domain-containing protein [Petrimonas sp.]|nr:LytTR family DNA-binding domain-containing protein [Petrimonas sp.]